MSATLKLTFYFHASRVIPLILLLGFLDQCPAEEDGNSYSYNHGGEKDPSCEPPYGGKGRPIGCCDPGTWCDVYDDILMQNLYGIMIWFPLFLILGRIKVTQLVRNMIRTGVALDAKVLTIHHQETERKGQHVDDSYAALIEFQSTQTKLSVIKWIKVTKSEFHNLGQWARPPPFQEAPEDAFTPSQAFLTQSQYNEFRRQHQESLCTMTIYHLPEHHNSACSSKVDESLYFSQEWGILVLMIMVGIAMMSLILLKQSQDSFGALNGWQLASMVLWQGVLILLGGGFALCDYKWLQSQVLYKEVHVQH